MLKIKHLYLLGGRVLFAVARPTALLVAAGLAGSERISAFTELLALLPVLVAMLSLPVHRRFYLEYRAGDSGNVERAEIYLGKIAAVALLGSGLVFVWLYAVVGSVLHAVTVAVVLIVDKVYDEVMRWCEFVRKYPLWFRASLLRNAWCFAYCLALFCGVESERALALAALCSALGIGAIALGAGTFRPFSIDCRRVAGSALWFPELGLELLQLASSTYRSGVRAFDRVLVSQLFPQYSAWLVALSMLASGIYILVDVFVFAPRKQLIARHPKRFFRAFQPRMMQAVKAATVITALATGFATTVAMVGYEVEIVLVLALIIYNIILGVAAQPSLEVFLWVSRGSSLWRTLGVNLACAAMALIVVWLGYQHFKSSIVLTYLLPIALSAQYLHSVSAYASRHFARSESFR
jgi:hypothetical protein